MTQKKDNDGESERTNLLGARKRWISSQGGHRTAAGHKMFVATSYRYCSY